MKKRILARHRNTNGDAIVLQKKVRPWYLLFLVSGWRDWKLLNAPLYNIEKDIKKCTDKLEGLLKKRSEELDYLRREKKDISQATMQTFGFGIPFFISVKYDQVSDGPNKWPKQVDESWKSVINPKLLRGERQGRRQILQDKIQDHGGRKDFAQVTAYTLPGDAKMVDMIKDSNPDKYDAIIGYKDNSNSNRKKNRNRNNNNNNNQRNNSNQRDNDWDDD